MPIRAGRRSDLDDLTDIYNHYVGTTHTTFDLAPVSAAERGAWLDQFGEAGPHRLWVLEEGARAVGYACSTAFKRKAAYRVSVETSVYLAPGLSGGGRGTRLMRALLESLSGEPVHGAFAGVALPNDASERLHEKLGYRRVGVLAEVGYKFDRYWDVAWYQKILDGEGR